MFWWFWWARLRESNGTALKFFQEIMLKNSKTIFLLKYRETKNKKNFKHKIWNGLDGHETGLVPIFIGENPFSLSFKRNSVLFFYMYLCLLGLRQEFDCLDEKLRLDL